MNASVGYLQIISAAVTPVVMISAAAALIIGINQKHVAVAEALRALTNEYRDAGTTEDRKADIQAQVPLFMQRLRYTATAHRWLYASEVCFVATVLVIILGLHSVTADRIAVSLFVLGVVPMLGAVAAEVLELRIGDQTIRREVTDVLPEHHRHLGWPIHSTHKGG